jgi:hypothetical protein
MSGGGRTNRRWPNDLNDELFIKRPHAVEQFRERAGLPPSYSFDRAEEDLRRAVVKEMMDGKQLRNKTGRSSEFVVRVAEPGLEVVYALVEEGAADGRYKFMIHTVFTQDMYQQWNEDGKLGSMGDLPGAKALKEIKPVPKEEPKPNGKTNMMILWREEGGKIQTKMVEGHNVSGEILMLLQQGCLLKHIEVFQKVKFDLSVKIGE